MGVHNGTCAYISGCSANGYTFFDSMLQCQFTCNAIINSDNNNATTHGDNKTVDNTNATTMTLDDKNQSIENNNETILPPPKNKGYTVKTFVVWVFVLCNFSLFYVM